MHNEQPEAAGGHDRAMSQMDPTGMPNLDLVLGGGIPRGALALIVGPPGSGKTTLASQIAFAFARTGRGTIIFTGLSEPVSKLIGHLSSFTFFEEDQVARAVQFLSLEQFLAGGLEKTGDEIVTLAHRAHARFVVLDGFAAMRGVDIQSEAARRFLYDVGTRLSVLGVTTAITSEMNPHDPSFFSEATTADVIIGLHVEALGVRRQRKLEIIKVRGARPLPGLHGIMLGASGVEVYPRLEAYVAAARPMEETPTPVAGVEGVGLPEKHAEERAPFDLPELDGMLSGGLTRGTSTLLAGAMGTGKTLFGLQFVLAGVRAGEPTLFVGLRETREQLLQKADPFRVGEILRAALAPGGGLTLLRMPPIELDADIWAHQVLAAIDRTGAKRVVVDSLTDLEQSALLPESGRAIDYFAALQEALRMRGVTSLFVLDVPRVFAVEERLAEEPGAMLAENVLLARHVAYQGKLHRVITVLKMRFSAHDTTLLREFTISAPEGIRMLTPLETGSGVGTEITRAQSSTPGPPNQPKQRQARRPHSDSGEDAGGAFRGGAPGGSP